MHFYFAGPVFTEWYWGPIFFAVFYGPFIIGAALLFFLYRTNKLGPLAKVATAFAIIVAMAFWFIAIGVV